MFWSSASRRAAGRPILASSIRRELCRGGNQAHAGLWQTSSKGLVDCLVDLGLLHLDGDLDLVALQRGDLGFHMGLGKPTSRWWRGGVWPNASTMPDQTELLSTIPLFASLPKKDLRSLAQSANDMTYEPGTRLASQDELGAMFFVVVSGEADVVVNGQHRKRLGPGEYFGEMSMIDRAPRSADVVAASKVALLVFTQWEFRPFLKAHPDVAWGLLEGLVKRLREVQKALAVDAS